MQLTAPIRFAIWITHQRAVLSRTSFLGANADWAETWYSDYARGPSAYGGKPGKVYKLYSDVVRNSESQGQDGLLRQLLEPRVQLGFMLVNVNLIESLPPSAPSPRGALPASSASPLPGPGAAGGGQAGEASGGVDGRERLVESEGRGGEDASVRAGSGAGGARASRDACAWSSLELAFPLHDSLDVVCTLSRVGVGPGGMVAAGAGMSVGGAAFTMGVGHGLGLGVPGTGLAGAGAEGVGMVVGWRAEEKYAKKLSLLNLQAELEGGKEKEAVKEMMSSRKLRLVEGVAARLKVVE